jgi:hypothetical protein
MSAKKLGGATAARAPERGAEADVTAVPEPAPAGG